MSSLMITDSRQRINLFTIALGYFVALVACIMQLVMYTAQDRQNYLELFADPFRNSRIETGFRYYMEVFYFFGISPDVAIVITCGLIYTLLARAWFTCVKINWLESILLFNFFTFSLFNYYLGTSIRMGLATALALYATTRIVRGQKSFLILVWISPFFQYGAIPFALTLTWVLFTQRISWRVHRVFILTACIALPISIGLILEQLGLSGHYMAYFNGTEGQTKRIFPFTFAFFFLALGLLTLQGGDSILRRIVFYGLPFLLYGSISGVAIFSKMLIANIFLSAMLITVEYRSTYVKNVDANLRLFLAVALNGLAMIYALRAYQYI